MTSMAWGKAAANCLTRHGPWPWTARRRSPVTNDDVTKRCYNLQVTIPANTVQAGAYSLLAIIKLYSGIVLPNGVLSSEITWDLRRSRSWFSSPSELPGPAALPFRRGGRSHYADGA